MAKKYNCPYCQYRAEREKLVDHIEDKHEEMIPEEYTARRIVYNIVNKRENGVCMICKGKTPWNEKAGKYDKLCGKESCRKAVREQYKKRMLKVYNTTCLLDDEERQQNMLAHRKISGTYKYSTGEEFTYTGSYEKKLLEFEDAIGIDGKDIMMPGPTLEYTFNGKTHKWITDQLLIPWNLIIEVKDGGDNPNNRDMQTYRDKQVAKEVMITELGTYNYIRLTNNQFAQLLSIMAELKAEMIDDTDENRKAVIRINEAANAATNAMPSGATYIIPYGYMMKNNFSGEDDIEGFALSDDIISDKLFIVKDGKVKQESYSFLKGRKYSLYRYTGSNEKIANLHESTILTPLNEVADDYFYKQLTGFSGYSKDILDYLPDFKKIRLEYIEDIRESMECTLWHRYHEAGADNEFYFPVIHHGKEQAKQDKIGDHDNLSILRDINGYFVLNTMMNQRSKSYANKPIEEASII
jgi:hypothetical protein